MNYQESVVFLDQTAKIGGMLGLENIKRLLGLMGNPQDQLKVIHVAGTNGKGSVTNIMNQILLEAGYTVGLFNSPNILSYRETIKLNGAMVSEALFAEVTTWVKDCCDQIAAAEHPHPTVFECFTAIALGCFFKASVDIAVVEVGLGGSLDATNVFTAPLACIITSISYDHMEFLGNTLEEIASAKAGIIKKGAKVIVAPNPENVLDVIRKQSETEKACIHYVDPASLNIHVTHEGLEGMEFSMESPLFTYPYLKTRLVGEHQLMNIATALSCLQVVREDFGRMDDLAVYQGLLKTYWPCRVEYLVHPVKMLLDGAHNEAGMNSFAQVLHKYASRMGITFLFGALGDKDVASMLKALSPFSDRIIVTQPRSERAMDLESLQKLAGGYFKEVTAIGDCCEALDFAVQEAIETHHLLCCVGSLYLTIPLRDYIDHKWLHSI